MTPAAQQLAIALACGWRLSSNATPVSGQLECLTKYPSYGLPPGESPYLQLIPDYLGSLDAMHAAENHLPADLCSLYNHTLGELMDTRWVFHASPTQRAEAFLKVLGKWDTTKVSRQ